MGNLSTSYAYTSIYQDNFSNFLIKGKISFKLLIDNKMDKFVNFWNVEE